MRSESCMLQIASSREQGTSTTTTVESSGASAALRFFGSKSLVNGSAGSEVDRACAIVPVEPSTTAMLVRIGASTRHRLRGADQERMIVATQLRSPDRIVGSHHDAHPVSAAVMPQRRDTRCLRMFAAQSPATIRRSALSMTLIIERAIEMLLCSAARQHSTGMCERVPQSRAGNLGESSRDGAPRGSRITNRRAMRESTVAPNARSWKLRLDCMRT